MRKSLTGKTILVVEDNGLIALDVATILNSEGAQVITVHKARDGFLIAQSANISLAVLDVKLDEGADCAPICHALQQRQIPFIFYTGYDIDRVTNAFPRAALLTKPASVDQLLRSVGGAISDGQALKTGVTEKNVSTGNAC